MGGSGKLKLIKNNLHFSPSFTCSVRTYRDYIVWEKKSQRTNHYLTKRVPFKHITGQYTISNIGRSDVGYIGWKAQKISKMQMPHNLDSLEWITNKTRRSSLSQEINKKQTNLIPINGQSSSAPGWKLLLVAAAKLLVFKIDIEVPDITCEAQGILISYSPCKFLVVGDPIFGLRGLFPIGFVALQSTVDDVYSCAKALNSK